MGKTFLMCKPEHFQCSYVINPWMNNNIGAVDVQLARKQWDQLYNIVSSHANVELIEPVPHLPDMVFTANAGLPILNNNYVWLSQFAKQQRQHEERHFHAWFMFYGKDVITLSYFDMKDPFEGAGDALVDSSGHYWFGYGQRSGSAAVDKIIEVIGQERCTKLELLTEDFYHLDTCFCPLTNGHVLWYPGAFSCASRRTIEQAFGDKLITVLQHDAVMFACNAVSIDNIVIIPICSDGLIQEIQNKGYDAIVVEMSEFIKAGGAAKCLTLQIE